MLSVITSVAFQASKVLGVRTLGQAITFDFVNNALMLSGEIYFGLAKAQSIGS
jgi:hypothetical protein